MASDIESSQNDEINVHNNGSYEEPQIEVRPCKNINMLMRLAKFDAIPNKDIGDDDE